MGALLATVGGVLLAGLLSWLGWISRKLGDVQSAVAVVLAQHQNNGGRTMKDTVDRIDTNVNALDVKVDDHLIASAIDSTLLHAHLVAGH